MAGVTGTRHAVHRHADMLAALGEALNELYDSGARVRLGELARWNAAARAQTVLVRSSDTTLKRFVRRADETVASFAQRITAGEGDGPATAGDAAARLQVLVRADLPTPDGANICALHAGPLDTTRARLLTASDLAASLAPDAQPSPTP